MSGECEKCGEHALDCECYERCKCDKHPATHENEFEMLISEYGMIDKVLIQEIDATCKTCKDKFKFTKRLYRFTEFLENSNEIESIKEWR